MTRRARLVCAVSLFALMFPAPVAAHGLFGRVESPLPLVVYLAGAAMAVALSFAFVVLRDVRAELPQPGPRKQVPRWLALVLRGVGLVAWLWIVAQTIVGGSSMADVGTLFLWVYGWVGIAIVSALIGPLWAWLDPFTTLYDIGAALVGRFGLPRWTAAPYPRQLKEWPAVVGFAYFVWLELVAVGGNLGLVLLAYTFVTLVAMAHFGRDAWRERGETFSVWFATLGRIAPFALDGNPAARVVRRRPYLAGLLAGTWNVPLVTLVAIATGSILFDGLSQTQAWFNVVGLVSTPAATLYLFAFLGVIVALSLMVGRLVGMAAMGAGLLPIALGYLLAHYLTYLLVDGQRIVVALSDPFQLGWDLFGTAFFVPGGAWLPASLVWSFQLIAVVGGHVVGAWAGHVAAARSAGRVRDYRMRQVPLALVMVALTATTLWSLGQAIVADPGQAAQTAATERQRR